jgi:hypothetical protein
MQRRALPAFALALLGLHLAPELRAEERTGERTEDRTRQVGDAAATEPAERQVRLLVSISIDQMLPDHLTRLEPWLEGGLGRFARQGRVFPNATLEFGETETGPGHASLGTGLWPSRHGIVANDWIGVDAAGATYCFEDRDAKPVTSAGVLEARSVSPRNLRALGFADHLRAAIPGSRSFAISSKDRSAIGMSGQRADLALWWDKRRGGFATSTWYASELPPWVNAWNAGWLERLATGEFGQGWNHALPEDFDASRTTPDESEGEFGRPGERSFPHRTPKFAGELSDKERALAASWVYDRAGGDVLVTELALIAQRELKLGQRGELDLLCVSLSSCDTVGHAYGPYSVEVADVLLRADRLLGRLFAQLDENVGAGRWVASLSADHGVMELPEALVARGIPAQRLSGRVLGEALGVVRPLAAAKFGSDFYLAAHTRGVRLSLAGMKAAEVEPAEVRKFYADELRKVAASWLEHALTFDELEAIARQGKEASSPLAALEAASFDEERTCDVVVLCKRHHLVGVAAGSTHGTPHDYDRSVPVAFYGAGVEHGSDPGRAHSIDVLPTLFALAGLKPPEKLDGRVLPTR